MKKVKHPMLSFSVIQAACNGNPEAINAVLTHYSGYIASLSTRPYINASGTVQMHIDPEMKRRLETKLITRILRFKIA